MKRNDKLSKNFIWNTAAGIINAGEAVFILMAAGRTGSLEDAGIITIAFAIGNLLSAIGRYGVRTYQVTDFVNKWDFSTYFSHRVFTVFIMGITAAGYMGFCRAVNDYSWYKIAVVLLVCMIYMVESFEDVFWGLYQKNGCLALGAKIFIVRWLIHLSIIIFLMVTTENLIISFFIGLAAGSIYSFAANRAAFRFFCHKLVFTKTGVGVLFKTCFPLFLTAFLTNYVTNAPKYAIDRYMSDSVQACYGYISMPVFVISLLNSFVYQPILVKITKEWNEGHIKKFYNSIRRQILIIAVLTLVCITGGYFLGIPVLSMMYHTDLTAYKLELLILLSGGGFLAVTSFLCVIMTVMRIQYLTMYGYIVTALSACIFSGFFVRTGGVQGAAWFYVFLMIVLTVFFMICVYRKLRGFSW